MIWSAVEKSKFIKGIEECCNELSAHLAAQQLFILGQLWLKSLASRSYLKAFWYPCNCTSLEKFPKYKNYIPVYP